MVLQTSTGVVTSNQTLATSPDRASYDFPVSATGLAAGSVAVIVVTALSAAAEPILTRRLGAPVQLCVCARVANTHEQSVGPPAGAPSQRCVCLCIHIF